MKKLLIIMLVAFSAAWSYLTAATDATKWYGVKMHSSQYVPTSFSSVTYYLQGDTTYRDTIYHALYRDGGEYCGGIRQSADLQQVYIRLDGRMINDAAGIDHGEYLLYDFDVLVGDTVWAHDHSYAGMDPMGEDTEINQYRWIVQKTQTIDNRKHVWVKGGQSQHEVEWIEGIGSRYIFFENNYNALIGTYSTWALCAADSEGNILYSFDTDYLGIHNNNCQWEPMAIDNVSTDKSSVSKLLRDGQLIIKSGDNLFNAEGLRIK